MSSLMFKCLLNEGLFTFSTPVSLVYKFFKGTWILMVGEVFPTLFLMFSTLLSTVAWRWVGCLLSSRAAGRQASLRNYLTATTWDTRKSKSCGFENLKRFNAQTTSGTKLWELSMSIVNCLRTTSAFLTFYLLKAYTWLSTLAFV